MEQVDRKVYVEWPDDNENNYRFVNSRLDEDSDPENTVRVPSQKEKEVAGRNVQQKKSNLKQVTIREPGKNGNQGRSVDQRANALPPRNPSDMDDEELQRETAYQSDLQRKLIPQQKYPPTMQGSDALRNDQKSSIPPLNFTDIDRSSMQEFIREEIDLNLRSSDEDDQGRKAAPNGRQPAVNREKQQIAARAKPKPLMKPPGAGRNTAIGDNAPQSDDDEDPDKFEQEAEDADAEDNNNNSRLPDELLPYYSRSPRGEMEWASKHPGGRKARARKNEMGQYPDFVAENKQVQRDKPKKSYVKMLKNKLQHEGEPPNVSVSAPARAGKAAKQTGGVDRELAAPNAQQDAAGFAPPQYVMPAGFGEAPPSYKAMMPPMASTLSAFYQQQVPPAVASQAVPWNFGPAPMPNAAPFGSQNVSGSGDAALYEPGQFQRAAMHSSQPDLTRMKAEESAMHRSLQLSGAGAGAGFNGNYAYHAPGAMQRTRTTSDAPTQSTLPPGDLFTTVTLQRHASPLPPINDHRQRVKQNAQLGIPASVSPGFDTGYRDMYVKQRRGVEYKKYTLRDYRNLKHVDKLDNRLGPDLDSAEYRERLEKRKRQQMYGRRVNTENAKIFAEEQEVLTKAKEDGARYVSYDHPEEIRERKRLEVVDVGDVHYTDRVNQKLATQRTARSEKTQFGMNSLASRALKRIDFTPPPLSFRKAKTGADDQPGDILNVRNIPPPTGSLAKVYQNMLIDTHRKAESKAEKAATALPANMSEEEFLKRLDGADASKQAAEDDRPKRTKRELAKEYAEHVRRQHKQMGRKKKEDVDSQKPVNSGRQKFSYGTYTYEFEGLDDQLVKLHQRHMQDKARADAIRETY